VNSREHLRNFLPTLTERGVQTIAQRIAINAAVTAPRAMPEFHSRELHLTKKLDAEPLAARDLDGMLQTLAPAPTRN
jgi:hypothetical protein